MGKSYRKVNRMVPISETRDDRSRKFISRKKRNGHHRERKINDSIDWVNSEKALCCTKHRKIDAIKDFVYNGINYDKLIVPNDRSMTLEDVLEPHANTLYFKFIGEDNIGEKTGDIPRWRDDSMNTENQIEEIIKNRKLSPNEKYGAKVCKKQLERRGKIGLFCGHDHTKDFTLPAYAD